MTTAPQPASPAEVERITAALAAPFDPSEIRWKPGVVSGNRALALAYVSTRTIQDRLDDVLGIAGWQDSYKVLADGSVVCRLRCLIGGTWISKVDVGSLSEQPDAGDRTKAAFSDALKRAAVKFGVGRFLYRLPSQWCDYDPAKRQFVRTPQLPSWAVPGKAQRPEGVAPPTGQAPPPARQRDAGGVRPATIGPDGAAKLIALADKKGRAVSAFLPSGVDAPGLLTAGQARSIWKQLDVLPDAPSANGSGHREADTVDLAAAAGPLPASRRSDPVPF
jgi:hypothetical protein